MAGQEKIRINKVLKEFNIGLGTLVEFLSKKGYEVESNPGAQISGEEYELVRKEYAKEQLIKEESRKIAIKVKEITKKESSRPEPEEEQFGDEVIIKTTTIDHPSTPEPANVEAKPESPQTDDRPVAAAPVQEPVNKQEPAPEAAATQSVPQEQKPAAASVQEEPAKKPKFQVPARSTEKTVPRTIPDLKSWAR